MTTNTFLDYITDSEDEPILTGELTITLSPLDEIASLTAWLAVDPEEELPKLRIRMGYETAKAFSHADDVRLVLRAIDSKPPRVTAFLEGISEDDMLYDEDTDYNVAGEFARAIGRERWAVVKAAIASFIANR
jgi:hypothetical protein